MDANTEGDIQYLAEFERQQFALYDARRLAAETHANAVIAATLATSAFVLADFNRRSHPDVLWLVVALVGSAWTIALATNARVVSWDTRWWLGGVKRPADEAKPSDEVRRTLLCVREAERAMRADTHSRVLTHWRTRAISAWRLCACKDKRLRRALWGLAGPAAYFAARLLA